MKSYSQAGQDYFVRSILGENTPRFFLDVGCAGKDGSNTLALEGEGWDGVLIDSRPDAINCPRKARFICADAKTVNLVSLPVYIDYLSLDVDDASYDALLNVLSYGLKFGVITIEHDAYRLGDKLRKPEREILSAASYKLVKADVCATEGCPMDDWWVSKELKA